MRGLRRGERITIYSRLLWSLESHVALGTLEVLAGMHTQHVFFQVVLHLEAAATSVALEWPLYYYPVNSRMFHQLGLKLESLVARVALERPALVYDLVFGQCRTE